MDGRIFLPTVAWSFKVRDVIFLTPATIENPATFRCTAIPFDSSDPGSNAGTKEIGFYITDNVGNIYTIIATGTHTVDVSDDFRCGVGPQTGKWAVLSKSVGNGDAPFLTPIHYRRLDKSAIDNVRRIELDILWKNESKLNMSAIVDTKGLTGFVNPSDIDVSYNWTNRTITLTGVLDYYWRGELHTLASPWASSAHPNVVGKWKLYSTDGETFAWSTDMWSFADCMVSFVNRQASAAASFAICETHGTMDHFSHEEDHQVNGTYLLSGGKATAGTYAPNTATDAANSPGFDLARIKDEDRETIIPAWIEGTYTTMYVGASNTSVFNIAATLPFISSGSYLQVNNALTGAMTDGINNRYYNVYQILIPCTSDADSQKFRTVFLQPQKAHANQTDAEAEAVNGLLFGVLEALTPEFKVYSRITYSTLEGDSNTGKCRIASITYVLGTKGNPINVGGVVPTNHADLSNLPWVDSGHTGTANKIAGFGVSGEAVEVDLKSSIPYDIDFEFADFTLGTAKTYTLDLKAKKAYTIEGIVLETDTGTLTGIAVKIGSTAVTSLSSLTATTIAETASTGAKTVALGDRVTFELSTGYTGAPTTIRGKLLRKLT